MKEIKLTKTDEKIYEEIKRIVKRNEKPTCAQIAQQIGIAPSSIIKLAKKLGYSGWNEMYYTLTQIYTEAVPLTFDTFDFVSRGQVSDQLRQLTELILRYKNSKIIVSCIGDSEFLTNYLLEMLWKRQFVACRYSSEIMYMLQDDPGAPGLCLFINESGIVLYNACIQLRALGYEVLALTSSRQTPLGGQADHVVEIKNKKSSPDNYMANFFAARAMIFLELLFAEIDERQNEGV